MYHPANYYAARTAAIKEALAQERANPAQPPCRKAKLQAPANADALCICGELVEVQLGVFFGDLAGEVVTVRRCYMVGEKLWYGLYHAADRKDYVLLCSYSPQSSIYMAISCDAALT